MPKKKTGARKKAEKQKEILRVIRTGGKRELGKWPCNATMECDQCLRQQKNRAFCYFCQAIQRLPVCGHCGKQKCMLKTGDCVVKHGAQYTTGMQMVGAVCDYCEAWVCHGRKCLSVHACSCPLQSAECEECKRGVWDHGGRIFQCAYCDNFLCEDDQFEHQARCQTLEKENYKCASCNKLGQHTCLRCKACYCDDHARRKGFKYSKGQPIPCPKCANPMREMSGVSARKYDYGRKAHAGDEDEEAGGDYDYYGSGSGSYYGYGEKDEDGEESDEEDEDYAAPDDEESEEDSSDEDEEEDEKDENEKKE
ncbi:zinc finger protein 330 homolog isoform X2 [Paramacrobiotus metropolitanus]|uniref:zinc finger protein 330 homolog isoform X2 n=1 Tax=Paramacrobiotus metropolitanus TaxID=2943436 RepID=UPI0024457791|nr:zinc finger protein 330 homolog isoform X2 [Paramacrobiotus metropolitanus]